MGCGTSSAKIYDANEAIRTNNTTPASQDLIATINVAQKGTDGRVPFLQACRYGRVEMVEFMLTHDKRRRIRSDLIDEGLLANTAGDTNRNLVFILVETAGANVNTIVSAIGQRKEI